MSVSISSLSPIEFPNIFSSSFVVSRKVEEKPASLTEEDLEKAVKIDLFETDTIDMFELFPICISQDTEEASLIRERNEKYTEVREFSLKLLFYLNIF